MTEQVTVDPRWGVQVEGTDADIADLREVLGSELLDAGDAFIWSYQGVPILRTSRWDTLSTAQEVGVVATEFLRLVSGCLHLLHYSSPLAIGTIYEFHGDGRWTWTRTSEASVVVKVATSDRVSQRYFRQVLALADDQEWFAGCLPLLSPPNDWFSLYKALEAIEARFGGETAMVSCAYLDGAELKRAKRTANYFRHHSSKHTLPSKPMELHEAERTIRAALIAIISQDGGPQREV